MSSDQLDARRGAARVLAGAWFAGKFRTRGQQGRGHGVSSDCTQALRPAAAPGPPLEQIGVDGIAVGDPINGRESALLYRCRPDSQDRS